MDPFDPEKFKDDPAFAQFLATAIGEAKGAIEGKNKELLKELKAAKSIAKKFEGLDLDDITAKLTTLEALETKQLEAKGEYEKLVTQIKAQHEAALKAKDKLISDEQAETAKWKEATEKYLIKGGLATELGANNVNPVMLEAAVALLKDDVSVVDNNGDLTAMVGEQTIADHVKAWATSDVGKNFVLAGGSGGGAGGSGGGGGTADVEDYFNPTSPNHSYMKQREIEQEDPELFKKMRAKFSGPKVPGVHQNA